MDAVRGNLTKTLLVACDQSYWSGPNSNSLDPKYGPITPGTLLAEHPDSSPDSANKYPNTMPESWNTLGFSAWSVHARFDEPATGFGATVYRRSARDGTSDYIVAMQGTRGLNIQDWGGNLIYGWDKWSHSSVQDSATGFLRQLIDLSDVHNIHFTGQSLGGALAEYALYDYARLKGSDFDASAVTLTTFNGLGGIDGLKQNEPTFDPTIVANVDTAHFWVTNDLVSRLGGGHLNGAGHEYVLDFKKATDKGVNLVRDDGADISLEFIAAHRIESGFYRGFNLAAALPANGFPADFTQAIPKPIADLGIADLARHGTYVAWLTNQDGALSTDAEAYARTAAALLASTAFGHTEEFERLVVALADSLYASNQLTKLGRDFVVRTVPTFLQALARSPSGTAAEMAAEAIAVVVEAGGQSETVEVDEGLGTRLVQLISEAGLTGTTFPVGEAADTAKTFLSSANGLSKTEAFFRAAACMAVAADLLTLSTVNAATQTAIHNIFRLLTQDVPGIVVPIWREVSQALRETVGEKSEAFAKTLGEVRESLLEAVVNVSQALSTFDGQTLAEDVQKNVSDGLAEVAKSISNGYGELTRKFTDAFEWGAALDRQTLQQIISSLLAEARSTTIVKDDSFDKALEVLQGTAQTVVVRPDRGLNPFDDPSFDPDASPLSTGMLSEGSLSTWTVYLPYDAGADGQRIELRLAGAAADRLSVLADGGTIDVDADGTFTVTVAEGAREATIEIAALADVDADAAYALSATLVNSAGEATHLRHEEAQIQLAARVEAPPVTAREIRGDWAPKPFTDPLTGATVYHLDDTGLNVERIPGSQNTSGFQEPDSSLDGTAGSDHIVTGDFEEQAFGYAGDDVIEGSDLRGSIFFGGAGEDWIEAGRYDAHEADYLEISHLGRTIRLGEDKLYGGAGDDRIYGDREADLAALYDPRTAPTGLPGDWSSGGSGEDEVYGGAGDDVLMGGAGGDLLVGGAGMDVLVGDDHLLLRPEGTFWTVVHPGFGDDSAQFGGFEVGLFPVVNATLDAPDLVFAQTGDPDFAYYKDGGAADVLIGGAGKDILIGQAGADTLYGGEDDDILAGWEGDDRAVGGAGDDLMAGDFGRYEVVNERTVDGVQLVQPGVLGSSAALGTPVEQTGSDFLDGGAGNDRIWGEGGSDELLGGDGDDALFGDAPYLPDGLHGADRLDGGAGNDLLYGGGGDDRLSGGSDDDILNGEAGNDLLDGGAGNDRLSGGEGDDVLQAGAGDDFLAGDAGTDLLQGGEGDDRLDGGDAADSLDGGSGDDVLEAGDGDDRLDGGAGRDVVRGGAGNDTYAFALGCGEDSIEDFEGRSFLRFGAGIAPSGLTATLDAATLTAALSYGFAGDSVSVAMEGFQAGGVQFADGTQWSAARFLALVPALRGEGSAEDDLLEASASLRNDLRGFEGDDSLAGSANDDRLEGGAGADLLEGAGGSDAYVFGADEEGIDTLGDAGIEARAYLDWYYGKLGIEDWADHTEDGTLPELAPLVRRDDSASLENLRSAGVLSWDVVDFNAGLSLDDLALVFRINEEDVPADGEARSGAGTLSVRWNGGASGFDVAVPDVDYGLVGADLLADGSWRGYRLGEGVEAFRFSDGSSCSLEDVLGRASVVELAQPYHFFRGSGEQAIDRNVRAVVFEDFIGSSEVAISRDGADLLLTLADGSRGRIAGWYADPADMPVARLEFAFDAPIEAAAATEAALVVSGTEKGELLQGLDGFADTLFGLGGGDTLAGGSGDDTLDGGTGADVYVLEPGTGHDRIQNLFSTDPLAEDVLRAAPGLDADDLLFSRSGIALSVWLRGSEDRIELDRWFGGPEWRLAGVELDDGSFLDADAIEARLEPAPGTAGDDAIEGTERPELLDGLAGDDLLLGGAGDDLLRGGAGADDLEDWEGHNVLEGGAGDDYLYHEGHSFLVGGAGDDVIETGGPDSVIAFNPRDGDDTLYVTDRITLSLGGGLAPEDLALRQDGEDLVLSAGDSASVRFSRRFEDDPTAWPQITLQMFGSVHLYDFNAAIEGLYGADDPSQPLALAALLRLHETATTESEALSGALAWRYASAGTLDGLSEAQVRSVLADPAFGASLQSIVPEAVNAAPVVANPIADQTASEDEAFSFVIGPEVFTDADGDTLSLAARLADGEALPPWLTFDPESGRLSGTPGNDDVGATSVRVTASDAEGASVSDVFDLAVLNTNDAPFAALPIAGQAGREGDTLAFAVPAGTFADVDAGDTLALAATLADGSALPAWLAFDPSSGAFGGTPGLADGGDYAVRVTATDAAGASASAAFVLAVTDSLARGNTIIGTAAQDVLNGTSANEQLDGRVGADRLIAGAGDDTLVYSADARWHGHDRVMNAGSPGVAGSGELRKLSSRTRTLDIYDGGPGSDTLLGTPAHDAVILDTGDERPQLADIERFAMGEGNDVVDLTSQRFAYGDVTIEGGAGNDVLWSNGGDDVLAGGRGNDELAGGAGDDVYLWSRGDGHDTLVDSGGADTLLFGSGVEPANVRVRRHHRDLVLRVGEPGGGDVTIADWFAAERDRIERIEFADGTAWDARTVETRFDDRLPEAAALPGGPPEPDPDDRSPPRHGSLPADHGRDEGRSPHDSVAFAISRLAAEHFRSERESAWGKGDAANADSREEIRRRWAAVQRFAERLAYEADDMRLAAPAQWQAFGLPGSPREDAMGFGFEASLGIARRANGLESFAGLEEGFKRL